MKIGILGGSFDPVHCGHLAMAESAQKHFGLDKILFIPAKQAPLKDNKPQASERDRLAMLAVALKACDYVEISTVDMTREGISYSYDTVSILEETYPQAKFYWIIGADQSALLPKWHRITDLVRKVSFICFSRPGYTVEYPAISGLNLLTAPYLDAPVSSKELRKLLAEGKNTGMLLPTGVLDYIHAHCLYGAKQ